MKIMLHDPKNRLPKTDEGCVYEWWGGSPLYAYSAPSLCRWADLECVEYEVLMFWPTRRWAGKAQVWEASP